MKKLTHLGDISLFNSLIQKSNFMFKSVNKNNPCPICQRTKSCTFSDNNLLLCWSNTNLLNLLEFENIGYRYVGDTKPTGQGLWGKFVPLKGDYSEAQKKVYQETKKLKEDLIKDSHKESLTIPERNQAFLTLHQYFGLTKKHREHLKSRGLTDSQIDKLKAFSLAPYSQIPDLIPNNFPGVFLDKKGNRVIGHKYNSGLVIPSYDENGLINGCEVRQDDVSHGKYLPLKTSAKGERKEISMKLQNGEMPITYFGNGTFNDLWLHEGKLKPYVSHCKHGIAVLGASGGYFKASPKQSIPIIEKYERIIVAVDAGDLLNEHRIKHLESLNCWLNSLKKKPLYAWNYQITKKDNDIDEIDSLNYELVPLSELTLVNWAEIEAKSQELLNRKIQKTEPQYGERKITSDFIYENEQELIDFIVKSEHKIIVDCTATGGGKTFSYTSKIADALLGKSSEDLEGLEVGKSRVFFASSNHNNPDIAHIESTFRNYEPRTNFWALDYSKRTPYFKMPYRKANHFFKENSGLEKGNCINSHKFQNTYENGLESLVFKPMMKDDEHKKRLISNQICGHCPQMFSCIESGYLKGVQNTLSQKKITLDIKQLNGQDIVTQDDFVIVDEIDKISDNLQKKYAINQEEFTNFLGIIQRCQLSNIDVDFLTNFLKKINDLFDNETLLGKFKYGYEHELLIDYFKDIDYEEMLEKYLLLLPNLAENSQQSFTQLDLFGNEETFTKKLSFNNSIEKLLEVLTNTKKGYLFFQYGVLTIQQKPDLHFLNAQKLIFLSATPPNKSFLSNYFSLAENEIIFIERKLPNFHNLTVQVITDNKGFGSGKISEKAIERIKPIIEMHQKNGYLIFGRKHLEGKINLTTHYWSGLDRGSNLYEKALGIVAINLPFINIGAAKANYYLAYGNLENFDDYYQQLIKNDILQQTGRLRPSRRENEFLHFILFCKDLDVQFLLDKGYAVVKQSLVETDFTSAMTKNQLIKKALDCLVDFGKECAKGIKNIPTLSEIKDMLCERLDTSVSQISKIMSAAGYGYKSVKRFFHFLYKQSQENGKTTKTTIAEAKNQIASFKEDIVAVAEETGSNFIQKLAEEIVVSIGDIVHVTFLKTTGKVIDVVKYYGQTYLKLDFGNLEMNLAYPEIRFTSQIVKVT
jgi:hypothetical protein